MDDITEALIENGIVVNTIIGHLPNSLPLEEIHPTLTATQRSNGFTYDIQATKVVKVYNVEEIPLSELQTTLAKAAREKRNDLLAATDWTANSDVTMTTEMTAYRTLLRNLPQQADFPTTINWPTAP